MIFKVFRSDEWANFREKKQYNGSADDKKDGFIHLSTENQLLGTLNKHFGDEICLIIAHMSPLGWGESLKWEASRAGALFPHLYADMVFEDVSAFWNLQKTSDQSWVLSEIERALNISFPLDGI